MWTLRFVFSFFLLLGLIFLCVPFFVCRSFFFYSVTLESYIRIIWLFRVGILILSHQMIFHIHGALLLILWISSEIGRIHFYMIYLISVHGLDFFLFCNRISFVKCQQLQSQKKNRTMWFFYVFFGCCWFGNLTLIHNTKVISFNFISTINKYLITKHWSKSFDTADEHIVTSLRVKISSILYASK